MIANLATQGVQTLDQIRGFIDHSEPLGFAPPDHASTYDWFAYELRRFGYPRLGKADKGMLKRCLARVTGLSHVQITQLVQHFVQTGRIADRRGNPLGRSHADTPPRI